MLDRSNVVYPLDSRAAPCKAIEINNAAAPFFGIPSNRTPILGVEKTKYSPGFTSYAVLKGYWPMGGYEQDTPEGERSFQVTYMTRAALPQLENADAVVFPMGSSERHFDLISLMEAERTGWVTHMNFSATRTSSQAGKRKTQRRENVILDFDFADDGLCYRVGSQAFITQERGTAPVRNLRVWKDPSAKRRMLQGDKIDQTHFNGVLSALPKRDELTLYKMVNLGVPLILGAMKDFVEN